MSKKEKHRPTDDEPGHLFLWHPKAIVPRETMPTRGLYADGYPAGAIIHATGGSSQKGLQDALDAVQAGISDEYTFLCISRDGKLVQAHSLNEWGYHAGQSYWPSLGKSLSSKLIGISLCGAGKVEPHRNGLYKNKNGIIVPQYEVRKVEGSYGCEPGYYHTFSIEQERALWSLLVWLQANDPHDRFKIENIFGHHEVSGGPVFPRGGKTGPGGSLSLSMEMFRNGLKFYSVEHLAEGFNGFEN
ncbi:MAG: hypothetical protein EBZ49_00070 [Proteobacteria bacterium]|nr:hypothetical protein [Pseudomonadota bacterium]